MVSGNSLYWFMCLACQIHIRHVMTRITVNLTNRVDKWICNTLKRDPMDENLDDFEDSSAGGGNKLATKEHFEAVKRS